MHTANEPAEVYMIHNEQDTVIGCLGCWLVVNRQQNARNGLNNKEKEGDPAQVVSTNRAGYLYVEQRPHQSGQSVTAVQPVPGPPDDRFLSLHHALLVVTTT